MNIETDDEMKAKRPNRSSLIGLGITLGCLAVLAIIVKLWFNNYEPYPVFSQDMKEGKSVSVEIVSIAPIYSHSVLYSSSSFHLRNEPIEPDSLICACKTTDESVVYVYITLKEYKENFDQTAEFVKEDISLTIDNLASYMSGKRFRYVYAGRNLIVLDKPVKLLGIVQDSSELIRQIELEQEEKIDISFAKYFKFSKVANYE